MTTTDPTITIAGLRAQVATLIDHLASANPSRGDFSSLYSQHSAKVAAAEAERDALAAQLAEVRAELVQLGGADLARDAAEDRAARLDADLAKLRAELAAAPKVCAIHSYALEGPCMTCGAWPPGTRELIAACQTRIAGLESAANERSAEVARLTADYMTVVDAIMPRSDGPAHAAATARSHRRHIDELEAEVARMTARVAELEAETRVSDQRLADQHDKWTARVAELEARPVPPEVFASLDELARTFWCATGRGYKPEQWETLAPSTQAEWIKGTAAVLARLEVSLVAPVDLAAIERAVKAYRNASGEHAVPADALGTGQWRAAVLAMTDAFVAAGIPVTPEVGK